MGTITAFSPLLWGQFPLSSYCCRGLWAWILALGPMCFQHLICDFIRARWFLVLEGLKSIFQLTSIERDVSCSQVGFGWTWCSLISLWIFPFSFIRNLDAAYFLICINEAVGCSASCYHFLTSFNHYGYLFLYPRHSWLLLTSSFCPSLSKFRLSVFCF